MTAEALIAALAREGSHVPFLVTTGAGDEQAAMEMLKLGAYGCLVQDARLADRLLAAVDRLVEQLALETRLAEAENALRESRELFRSFVHQSSDGIALVDEQGKFIEWNASLEQLTGVKREAALGHPAWEVLAELVVEGKRTPVLSEQMKALFPAALQAGQAPFFGRPMEVVVQRADGTRRIVRQCTFPIQMSRGFHIGVIDRDLTQQKHLEAALRDSETLKPGDEAAALVQDALHLPESGNRGEGDDGFARLLP